MFIGGETYILRKLNQLTLDSMEKFIKDYQIENGSSPSYRKIMHALKMSSLNLVQTYVLALEEQGRIQRTELGNIHLPPKLNTGETVCRRTYRKYLHIAKGYFRQRKTFYAESIR
jgi:SOS-response transcriptional repressor LexA